MTLSSLVVSPLSSSVYKQMSLCTELEATGFIVSRKKSQLSKSQVVKFLGFI
jgi:hypothetical protein